MDSELIVFTTDILKHERKDVSYLGCFDVINSKEILNYYHPIAKENSLKYLKLFLTTGENNFTIAPYTVLTFYVETDENRFARFSRIWNFPKVPISSFIDYRKYDYFKIDLKDKSTNTKFAYSSLCLVSEDIPLTILSRLPSFLRDKVKDKETYLNNTEYSNNEITVKFYTAKE